MYTTHSKPYPDLIRVWHKRTLQGLPRSSPRSKPSTRKTLAASNSHGISAATSNKQIGLRSKDKSNPSSFTQNSSYISDADADDNDDNWYDDYNNEDEDEFPPYVDPTEEQELCIDPIRALAIPRSRYRTITELTLCRKGITRLHPNVQLLENLDTLIIRHNRLRQIDFLLPTSGSQEDPLTATAQSTDNNNAAAKTTTTTTTTTTPNASGYNIRGCRLLRRLYASHNSLQTLDGDVSRLRQLEVLTLAHNRLGNLRAVSARLKPLRWLRELDLRGNPLCDEVGYRLFLIHEHPNIEILDRRAVRPEERKAAAEMYGSNRTRTPQSSPVNTLTPLTLPANTAEMRMAQSPSPLRRTRGEKQDGEEEEEEGQRREGSSRLTPRAVTFPSLTQPQETPTKEQEAQQQEEQEQQQQQQIISVSTSPARETRKETPKKTVAFLRTFTHPPEAEDTTAMRKKLFQPSPCEVILKNKIRLIETKRLKKQQLESEKQIKEEQEVQEKYRALHATWALSRQGMPLSSENWHSFIKALETTPSGASVTSNEVSSSTLRRQSTRRKSYANRQQTGETTTTSKSNTMALSPGGGIDIEEIQLPPVTPVIKGHVDYSVLYDALLGHSDIVNMRLGKRQECLPTPNRLLRMEDVLNKTAEVLHMQLQQHQQQQQQEDGTLGDLRSKQVQLFRAIQQEKESLIPEPWEQTTVDGLTLTMNLSEQLEYLYHMAMAFFLPTELSALEGQFMTNTAEVVMPQETQRMKRPMKKEKHRSSDTGASSVINGTSSFPTTNTFMQQRLPTVLTATNVEVGPPERTSFLRVMNMLDGESGAWNLNLDEMTAAFCFAYQSKARVSIVDALGKGEEERGNASSNRRGRRSLVKPRVKSERRHAEKTQSNTGESRSNTSAATIITPSPPTTSQGGTTGIATRSVTLMLNVILLDLLRYVPFVESRLAFFRAKCVATASKGEGGATGEAAREWFAKAQLAETHLEKLLQALKRAGLKREEANIRLVPQESMVVRPVQEVGELFRERAHLLKPMSSSSTS